MSDLTIKRVLMIVLVLIITVPLLEAEYFFNFATGAELYAGLLANFYSEGVSLDKIGEFLEESNNEMEQQAAPFLFWDVPFDEELQEAGISKSILGSEKNLELFRNEELDIVLSLVDLNGKPKVVSLYRDYSRFVKKQAIMNMGRTFFVLFVLVVGAVSFSRLVHTLILQPIERMIDKINLIARNPLSAKESMLVDEELSKKRGILDWFSRVFAKPDEGLETEWVENAIDKIGVLLALGFGEAGAEIISSSLVSTGEINPLLPGIKKMAIIGASHIRNFTDVTEVLQEEVMVFVNTIAEIVHSVVDKNLGAINRNTGGGFLIVWKMPRNSVTKKIKGRKEKMKIKAKSSIVNNFADLALISFMKIHAKINRKPQLVKYLKHEKLQERIPSFRVRLGFGIHVGWAIEGPIGSYCKIDASYLSPSVQMAECIEEATKHYGIPLLFSGQLHKLLSLECQDITRQIDKVVIAGSKKPISLFTVDISVSKIRFKHHEKKKKRENLIKHVMTKKQRQNGIKNKSFYASDLLERDRDLITMLQYQFDEFKSMFQTGLSLYLKGDWAGAKEIFESALKLKTEGDGPTRTLLNHMESFGYLSPAEWPGYRVLIDE